MKQKKYCEDFIQLIEYILKYFIQWLKMWYYFNDFYHSDAFNYILMFYSNIEYKLWHVFRSLLVVLFLKYTWNYSAFPMRQMKVTDHRTASLVDFPLNSLSRMVLFSCICIHVFAPPGSQREHHVTQKYQKETNMWRWCGNFTFTFASLSTYKWKWDGSINWADKILVLWIFWYIFILCKNA